MTKQGKTFVEDERGQTGDELQRKLDLIEK